MAKLTTLQPRLKPTQSHTPKKNWGQGRGGRAWRRLRDEILARDSYTCQCCGRVGGKLELDHIINVAQGGTNDKSNLQILCQSCHKQKTQLESKNKGYVFMPEWLQPIPNAVLVFGCSGSGKSTWAKNHNQGRVIIDLDEIIALQTGKPIYEKDDMDYANGVRMRNQILLDMAKNNTPCIIILTGNTPRERAWWQNKIKPSQIVVMDTPKDECIKRILADERRPAHIKNGQIQSLHLWRGAQQFLNQLHGHHPPTRA